jgi:tRNA U55 pseudouridine synthase TruB
MMIRNFVNLGMTKMAQAYMAQKERETMAKMEEEKAMAIEQQNQAVQQQIQAKAEADAQLVQLDMQKITLVEEEKRKTLQMEYGFKMEIKKMELEAKADENLMNQIVEENKPKENLKK